MPIFKVKKWRLTQLNAFVCGHRTWGRTHNGNALSTEGVWNTFISPGLESGGGDSCPSTETHLKWKDYRIPVEQTRTKAPVHNWLYNLGWVTSLLWVSIFSFEKWNHNIHSKELLRGGWYHACRKSQCEGSTNMDPFTIPPVVGLWEEEQADFGE